MWHDPIDEPVCEVPFDFSFEREDSSSGMRDLIIDEVRSFRQLVRQNVTPAPAGQPHDLPPAPAAVSQPGAGVGPAFHDAPNHGADHEEHPSSALERGLDSQPPYQR